MSTLPTLIMIFLRAGLVVFCGCLSIQSCGLDVEDSTRPSPPRWVDKSIPDEWPERGIDAIESSEAIYLEWEENPEDDIAAYYIYRAVWNKNDNELGDFFLLAKLEAQYLEQKEYLDDQTVDVVRYYYKLRAGDDSNNLSDYSDLVYYTLLSNIRLQTMTPNAVSDTLPESRILSWQYTYTIEMENYQVTILSELNDLIHRVTFSPGNYAGSKNEEWVIPQNVTLVNSEIYKWRIDTAARYVSGFETSGSESSWAYFQYFEH